MAVHHRDGFRDEAVIIPAGAVVEIVGRLYGGRNFDHARLVEIGWDGRTVRMFLLDLLERGQRMDGAGG